MSSFWRSVSSVFMGTLLAQVIPIAGALVIARQYLPEAFGVYSVWLGVVTFLSVVLTARYEAALALEEDGAARQYAVFATVMMTLVLTALAVVVIGAMAWLTPSWLDELSARGLLLLTPSALALALSQIWQSWAAAEGSYKYLSVMRIVQAAGITLLQILAGVFLATADALAAAYLAGVLLGCLVSVIVLRINIVWKWRAIWPASKIFWYRQKNFPIFALPADSISAASAQLPVLIVAARFGAETAGWLAMAMRMLGAPIGLLGKAVLDVFKRRAAQSFRDRGECRADYLQTFQVLGAGSLAFCLVMFFWGQEAFVLLLGPEWAQAGVVALWLTPLFMMRFIASPLSYMVYIAGKQHLDLFWQAALLAVTYFSLHLPQQHDLALQLYSAGYSLLYVVYLVMSYRFSLGKNR
ncbi:lipopolysaccharide biosynthesis protein [Pusillimonas sp. CC-YST705]|uniref:Lipopolysaccharide biosynthesis protein n=1 Tax=Mesopusillimonas faecipullorum TaxID=2755040 RepID=A0ABS8CCA5_9BURK|nr:lipopolysaccharide biosynthesis protein [Mesopusillimonas faecipullorum]MCB5363234.1 lipopolysaccharide biosynthesis protein [Mesopusillimonas faecipullorum]